MMTGKLGHIVLGGEIHFRPVEVGEHPLAEAAFVERVGGLMLLKGIARYDFGTGDKADGSALGIGAIIAKSEKPFYGVASFLRSDVDIGSISMEVFDFGIGWFLRDGFLVGFDYQYSETDGVDYKLKHNVLGISTKWVHEMEGGRAVNIEGFLGEDNFDDNRDDGSNRIVEVSGDYYINPKISLGAGVELNTGDDEDDEGNTYEARFRVFFNKHISIGASLEKFSAENDNTEDNESIEFNVSFRF